MKPALQTQFKLGYSNVCKAAPISLFWGPDKLNELPEVHFKFPFILVDNLTIVFLTGQPLHMLKSQHTGEGLEQGFRCCFADGLNQGLALSVAKAT